MRALMLLVCLSGCTTQAGPMSIIHRDEAGFWLLREAKVSGTGGTDKYQVLFYCRKPEQSQQHPQCYSTEYYHARAADLFWPEGMVSRDEAAPRPQPGTTKGQGAGVLPMPKSLE